MSSPRPARAAAPQQRSSPKLLLGSALAGSSSTDAADDDAPPPVVMRRPPRSSNGAENRPAGSPAPRPHSSVVPHQPAAAQERAAAAASSGVHTLPASASFRNPSTLGRMGHIPRSSSKRMSQQVRAGHSTPASHLALATSGSGSHSASSSPAGHPPTSLASSGAATPASTSASASAGQAAIDAATQADASPLRSAQPVIPGLASPETFSSTAAVEREGLLTYKVQNKHWKQRYVVMKDGHLLLYDVDACKQPVWSSLLQRVPLQNCSVLCNILKFKFIVVSPGGKDQHAFCADTVDAMDAWATHISAHVSQARSSESTPQYYRHANNKFSKIFSRMKHSGASRTDQVLPEEDGGADVAPLHMQYDQHCSAAEAHLSALVDCICKSDRSIPVLERPVLLSDLLEEIAGAIAVSKRICFDFGADTAELHDIIVADMQSCHTAAMQALAVICKTVDTSLSKEGEEIPPEQAEVKAVAQAAAALSDALVRLAGVIRGASSGPNGRSPSVSSALSEVRVSSESADRAAAKLSDFPPGHQDPGSSPNLPRRRRTPPPLPPPEREALTPSSRSAPGSRARSPPQAEDVPEEAGSLANAGLAAQMHRQNSARPRQTTPPSTSTTSAGAASPDASSATPSTAEPVEALYMTVGPSPQPPPRRKRSGRSGAYRESINNLRGAGEAADAPSTDAPSAAGQPAVRPIPAPADEYDRISPRNLRRSTDANGYGIIRRAPSLTAKEIAKTPAMLNAEQAAAERQAMAAAASAAGSSPASSLPLSSATTNTTTVDRSNTYMEVQKRSRRRPVSGIIRPSSGIMRPSFGAGGSTAVGTAASSSDASTTSAAWDALLRPPSVSVGVTEGALSPDGRSSAALAGAGSAGVSASVSGRPPSATALGTPSADELWPEAWTDRSAFAYKFPSAEFVDPGAAAAAAAVAAAATSTGSSMDNNGSETDGLPHDGAAAGPARSRNTLSPHLPGGERKPTFSVYESGGDRSQTDAICLSQYAKDMEAALDDLLALHAADPEVVAATEAQSHANAAALMADDDEDDEEGDEDRGDAGAEVSVAAGEAAGPAEAAQEPRSKPSLPPKPAGLADKARSRGAGVIDTFLHTSTPEALEPAAALEPVTEAPDEAAANAPPTNRSSWSDIEALVGKDAAAFLHPDRRPSVVGDDKLDDMLSALGDLTRTFVGGDAAAGGSVDGSNEGGQAPSETLPSDQTSAQSPESPAASTVSTAAATTPSSDSATTLTPTTITNSSTNNKRSNTSPSPSTEEPPSSPPSAADTNPKRLSVSSSSTTVSMRTASNASQRSMSTSSRDARRLSAAADLATAAALEALESVQLERSESGRSFTFGGGTSGGSGAGSGAGSGTGSAGGAGTKGPQPSSPEARKSPGSGKEAGSAAAAGGGGRSEAASRETQRLMELAYAEVNFTPDILFKMEIVEGRVIKRVKAGTVQALLAHLTSDENDDPDFLDSFVLTHRTFVDGHTLVQHLYEQHTAFLADLDACASAAAAGWEGDVICDVAAVVRCQQRNVLVLEKVLEEAWPDLTSEDLRNIAQMAADLLRLGHLEVVRRLRGLVLRLRRKGATDKGQGAGGDNGPRAPLSTQHVFTRRTGLLETPSMVLARQLTLMDARLFKEIDSRQVLAWSRKQSRDISPSIFAMIGRFNDMSLWCASLILGQLTLKERVKMLQKLVEVLKCLRKLHSFNALMALLSGINCAAVHRLGHTFEAAGTRTRAALEKLNALMSHRKSFAMYRAALKTVPLPVVPYLGMYLTDITFAHQGNKDNVPSSVDPSLMLVNFAKRQRMYSICMAVHHFQQVDYPFEDNPSVESLFTSFEHLNDQQLFELSMHVEPRNAPLESIA